MPISAAYVGRAASPASPTDNRGRSIGLVIKSEAAIETTPLDHIDVASQPLIREYLSEHGDKMVHFAALVPELVPGGVAINRNLLITDSAIYKIPVTATDTGIFFNSRYPLANFTQVLVIHESTSCCQFNGVKSSTIEQALFTVQFKDERRQRECLLTLCHLLPDLPMLRKKKVDGKYYDTPYMETLAAAASRMDGTLSLRPPRTRLEEAYRVENLDDEDHIPYLTDAKVVTPPKGTDSSTREVVMDKAISPATTLTALRERYSPEKLGSASPIRGPLSPQLVPKPVPMAMWSHDPEFEMKQLMLRKELFDHDLTNLQLRAELSLLDDVEEDTSPQLFNKLFTSMGRSGREWTGRSDDGLSLRGSLRSEEDIEAARRRQMMLQEERARRQEQERERAQIKQLLCELDGKMRESVYEISQQQQASEERIQARQPQPDRRLTMLRKELQDLKAKHRLEEEEAAGHRQNERLQVLGAIEAARSERLSQGSPSPRRPTASPVKISSPSSPHRESMDRILLGEDLHREFVRWHTSGGLLESRGVWSEEDSRALARRLKSLHSSLKRKGAKPELIARVHTMLGGVEGEITMLLAQRTPTQSMTSPRKVTVPTPFNLSKSNRPKIRSITHTQFRDELKERAIHSRERQQSLRQQHIEDMRHSPRKERIRSPRDVARRRGKAAEQQSEMRCYE